MNERTRTEIKDLENPDTVVLQAKDNDGKIQPLVSERIDEKLINGLFDPNRIEGFSTGYHSIDGIVGGLKVGGLVVLVASTGMGKSILAMNILVHLNRDKGIPVVYIDLENGILQATERLVKIWYGNQIPDDFFKNPKYKDDLLKKKEAFSTFKYYSHDDFPSVTREMVLKIIRYHAKLGVKVFLVDPLECVPGKDVFDKQREESDVVRDLKNLAQEEAISIILCHHFRKATSSGKDIFVGSIADVDTPKVRIPTLDDMRGNSEIANASTSVWALVRLNGAGGRKEIDQALVRVLKNRFGNLGDAYLNFEPYPLGFREFTTAELMDLQEEKIDHKKKKYEKKEKMELFDTDAISKLRLDSIPY